MINEETLILYYYDDGLSPAERREVEATLSQDRQLASEYENIRRQLDEVSEPVASRAPSHLVHRWHDSIDQAARNETVARTADPRRFSFMSFSWGAAVTAALAVGIAIGVYFAPGTTDVVTDIPVANHRTPDQVTAVPASFSRGLQLHLQESQRDISALSTDGADDQYLLLLQIIEQNRLFERAADRNNAPGVARLLRAFEPILLRMASENTTPEDVEALRQQLAFELNAMLTRMARETSKESHST